MPDHSHSRQPRDIGALRPVLGGALFALLALTIATTEPALVSAILGVGVLIAVIAGIALLTYKMLIQRRRSG